MLAFLLIIVPALFGCAVVLATKTIGEKITLLLIGSALGLVSFTTVIYGLSAFASITPITLVAICLALIVISVALIVKCWSHWRSLKFDRVAAIVLLVLSLLSIGLAPKLLLQNSDGLATGIINAWGDLGWHMSIVTSFAAGQPVPPQDPIFAGVRLSYPFLINYFSGLLMIGGASYTETFTWPALFLLPVVFTMLYLLVSYISRSRMAGVVAVILLFFGGSTLGWLQMRTDFTGDDWWQFLLQLPRDYAGNGGDPNGYHFLNIIMAGLLPQRSLLFGIPLAFSIIFFLLNAFHKKQVKYYILAGVCMGLLPLAHAHTAVALVPLFVTLFAMELWQRNKQWGRVLADWTVFGLTALLVGSPELVYFFTNQAPGQSFFHWGPGWTVGSMSPLWFWFQNTGLLLPLIAGALLLPIKKLGLTWDPPLLTKLFAIAGLIIFFISNLFLFAPWAWDNYKLLIFWLIFSLPILGWLAARGLRSKHVWVISVTLLLIIFHTATGAVDIWKTLLPTVNAWGEWDNDSIALAEKIKEVSKPQDIFVTAPYHNNPVALSGRLLYLGFPGHIWSHGEDPAPREAALGQFYLNQIETLTFAKPQYVIVGPVERQKYPNLIIRPDWQLVAQSGPSVIYKLP